MRDYRARIGGAFEDGMQQGIQQGKHQSVIEIAINALKMGIALDDIIKLTGLTYNEAEELVRQNNSM